MDRRHVVRVLAIDTAGPVIGVALWVDGRVTERTARVERGSEARLAPWARELCEDAGFAVRDVDGIAASAGPGAFTGLRVGLATAVGLAMAVGCPIWTTSSLEPRARRVDAPRVLALLDARKGRVYAALYEDGALVEGPGDVAPEVALSWTRAPFLATGEGAVVYGDAVTAAGGTVAPEADHPAVDVLGRLGAEALGRGEGTDPIDVRPTYLREPDARPPTRD